MNMLTQLHIHFHLCSARQKGLTLHCVFAADQVTAFVGADKLAIDNSEGNPIQLVSQPPMS